MVSVVFHSPFAAHAESKTSRSEPVSARPEPVEGLAGASTSSARAELVEAKAALRTPFDWRAMWLSVLPPLFGLGLLIGLWAIVSAVTAGSIPTPWDTFKQAVVIFSDPFNRKGDRKSVV